MIQKGVIIWIDTIIDIYVLIAHDEYNLNKRIFQRVLALPGI